MIASYSRPSSATSLSTPASGTPDPIIFDLQDFIEDDVLPEIAGGLDGCAGGLINTVPSEMDCNAAASVYIAGRFSLPRSNQSGTAPNDS